MENKSRLSRELFRKFSMSVTVIQYFAKAHHSAFLLDRLCSSSRHQFRTKLKEWTVCLINNREEFNINCKSTFETLKSLNLHRCMKVNFIKLRINIEIEDLSKFISYFNFICSKGFIKEFSDIKTCIYSEAGEKLVIQNNEIQSNILELSSIICKESNSDQLAISGLKVKNINLLSNSVKIDKILTDKIIEYCEENEQSDEDQITRVSFGNELSSLVFHFSLSLFYNTFILNRENDDYDIENSRLLVAISNSDIILDLNKETLINSFLEKYKENIICVKIRMINIYSLYLYKSWKSILHNKVELLNSWISPCSFYNVYLRVKKFKIHLLANKNSTCLTLSSNKDITLDYTDFWFEDGSIKARFFTIESFELLDIQVEPSNNEILKEFDRIYNIEISPEDITSCLIEIEEPHNKIESKDNDRIKKNEMKDHYSFLDSFASFLSFKTEVCLTCAFNERAFDLQKIKLLDYKLNITSLIFKGKFNKKFLITLETLIMKLKRLQSLSIKLRPKKLITSGVKIHNENPKLTANILKMISISDCINKVHIDSCYKVEMNKLAKYNQSPQLNFCDFNFKDTSIKRYNCNKYSEFYL